MSCLGSLLENNGLESKTSGVIRETRPSENEKCRSQNFRSEITKVLRRWKVLTALGREFLHPRKLWDTDGASIGGWLPRRAVWTWGHFSARVPQRQKNAYRNASYLGQGNPLRCVLGERRNNTRSVSRRLSITTSTTATGLPGPKRIRRGRIGTSYHLLERACDLSRAHTNAGDAQRSILSSQCRYASGYLRPAGAGSGRCRRCS